MAGGFDHQLCGREAALARAQNHLERVEAALVTAEHRRDQARSNRELKDREVLSVRAANEVEELGGHEPALTGKLQQAERRLADLRAARNGLSKRLLQAEVGLNSARELRTGFEAELNTTVAELRKLEDDVSSSGQRSSGWTSTDGAPPGAGLTKRPPER